MVTQHNRSREPRGPQSIGRIVSQLMARTGYDREQGSEALATAWRLAVPEQLAGYSRPGLVRRGVLEVFVTHSAIVQEFAFLKPTVLASLRTSLPAAGITDIRCRLADSAAGP
jgi:hypothetical protein